MVSCPVVTYVIALRVSREINSLDSQISYVILLDHAQDTEHYMVQTLTRIRDRRAKTNARFQNKFPHLFFGTCNLFSRRQ